MNISEENARNALVAMMLVAFGIEAYLEFKARNIPPRPARFVGVALVYGALSLLMHASASLAAALGAGLLIALVIKMPSINNSSSGIDVYGLTNDAGSSGGSSSGGAATPSTPITPAPGSPATGPPGTGGTKL